MALEVIRQAKIDVAIIQKDNQSMIQLMFADGRKHTFSAQGKEAKFLEVIGPDPAQLKEIFDGGHYVFAEERLIDYRTADYRGFVHSDATIAQLEDQIGLETAVPHKKMSPALALFSRLRGQDTNGVLMGGEWDRFQLQVPSLGVGGEFENRLVYRWSPFSPNIVSSVEIERLICCNGVASMSPLTAFETPIISDLKENLDVVTTNLIPRINALLGNRFESMAQNKASVQEVMIAHKALEGRMPSESSELMFSKDVDDIQKIQKLRELIQMVDVEQHLAGFYTDKALASSAASARLSSHLTQFDLYNIITEAVTHTHSAGKRQDNTLIMRASSLLFDNAGQGLELKNGRIPPAAESNPERAFFSSVGGTLSH